MPPGREMGAVLCLRVEGEAADITKEIRVPMRALCLVKACAIVQKIGAQHMVRGRGKRGDG